jgi:hypothetical protein
MEQPTLASEQCERHAQECRDMARRESNPDTKKKLDDLAAEWEHLCEELKHLQKRK